LGEQLPPSVADFVVLFTEKKLSQVDLFNAEADAQSTITVEGMFAARKH